MVNKLTDYLRIIASIIVTLMIVLVMSGCSNIDYKWGDISRVYCGTTNEEIRADLKIWLEEKRGAKIGINYCSSFGLVDAMVNRGS